MHALARAGALAVLLLSCAAAAAWPAKHKPCCFDDGPVILRAEVTEHTCVSEEPDHPGPMAHVQVSRTQGPGCIQIVPILVTDPQSGCTHTEYRQQVACDRVKHTVIEVGPKPPAIRKHEHVERTITIFIERTGACGHETGPILVPGH